MMDFDATRSYLSAMYDEKSVHLKIETRYAVKPHMNEVYVEAFNIQTFNQDGNESAILKMKYYNPPDLINQHLPIKEKLRNIEVNTMRNGNILDTFTSVDIQEIAEIGGKRIEIYEGIIYRENFRISPLRKVIENLFALRQKYIDEHRDLMQNLVELLLNRLYGVQIRKDNIEFYICKSEHWMQTEYGENDYWRLQNGICIVKFK